MDVIVSTTAKVIVNGLDNKTANRDESANARRGRTLPHPGCLPRVRHNLLYSILESLEIYNEPELLVVMMASGIPDKKTNRHGH